MTAIQAKVLGALSIAVVVLSCSPNTKPSSEAPETSGQHPAFAAIQAPEIDWGIPDATVAGGDTRACFTTLSSDGRDPKNTFENTKGCTAVAVFTGTRSGINDMLDWNGRAFKKTQEVLKSHGLEAHVTAHFTHRFYESCYTSIPKVLPCQPGIEVWFTSSNGYGAFLKDLNSQLASVEGGFALFAISRPTWDIYLNAIGSPCAPTSPLPDPLTYGSPDSEAGPYQINQINALAASHRQLFNMVNARFKTSFVDGANFLVNNLPATSHWYHNSSHWLEEDGAGEFGFSITATPYTHIYVENFAPDNRVNLDGEFGTPTLKIRNRCDSQAASTFHVDKDGFVRNDSDGSLHLLFQTEALGGGAYGATHPLACSGNWHMPTIRELAAWAQAHGAKGILETSQAPSGQIPAGYQLINAKNLIDGSSDDFYYSSAGYVPPAGDMGRAWFASSSIRSSDGGVVMVFHGVNGIIAPSSQRFETSAVRCLAN